MKFDIRQFLTDKVNDGMGIREIGRLCSIDPTIISRILKGKRNPKVETIERILKGFDLNFRGELISGKNDG